MSKSVLVCLLICCSSLLSAQVPEVLYLKFNEGSGATTADSSLLGLPGFNPVLNAPSSASAWNTTSPKLGPSCLEPSTSISMWSFNSNVQLTNDWTIEFWYYISDNNYPGNRSPILDTSTGGFVFRNANNSGDAQLDSDDMALVTDFGTFVFNHAFSKGAWHHLAIVCDKAEETLTPYVDGNSKPATHLNGLTDIVGNDPAKFFVPMWDGSVDEIRFWDHARTQAEILADMTTELSTAGNDLIVSAITSPVYVPRSYVFPSANEAVTCEIENAGTNVIAAGTPLALSFQVNGSTPQTEMLTLATSLAPGDRLTHSFLATADLSGIGPQTVKVTVNWAGDSRPTNNSRERTIGNSKGTLVNEFPWFEDFEDTPKLLRDAASNWLQEMNSPPGSQEGAWYGYKFSTTINPSPFETVIAGAAGYINGVAMGETMLSPTFDLRGLANPRIRFWANCDASLNPFNQGTIFALDVIEYPSLQVATDFYTSAADLGMGWVELQIDLSSYAGKVVDLRFKSQVGGLANYGQPVYIDEVLVYDHQIGMGQEPQLGLAEFEINDSENIGMNPVSYGEAGPYFQSAAPGESLAFSFRGAPAQPLLLVYGPMNPVAATFPGIGQLDIGGALDPMTGIPTLIQILFDGYQSGGLNGLFVTGPTGEMVFTTPMPYLPPGILTTFQAVLRDPVTGLLAISNAVQLEVN